jgi:hypothetical protein
VFWQKFTDVSQMIIASIIRADVGATSQKTFFMLALEISVISLLSHDLCTVTPAVSEQAFPPLALT